LNAAQNGFQALWRRWNQTFSPPFPPDSRFDVIISSPPSFSASHSMSPIVLARRAELQRNHAAVRAGPQRD